MQSQNPSRAGEPAQPVCVVFGATGKQGQSVLKRLSENKDFKLRAVARDKKSTAGSNMYNAEVVEADLNRPDSIQNVLKGAQYCFLVTNFWDQDTLSEEKEYQQAKNVIDSAKSAGLRHLIFSMAENTEKASGGKISVPHFMGKGRAADYLQTAGINYTNLKVPFYYENFLSDFKPQVAENGHIILDLPLGGAKLPMMSIQDLGNVVWNILKNPDKYNQRTIFLGAESFTLAELCSLFSDVLEKKIEPANIKLHEWVKETRIPGADKCVKEWQYLREFPQVSQRIDQDAHDLLGKHLKLRDFLVQNKDLLSA